MQGENLILLHLCLIKSLHWRITITWFGFNLHVLCTCQSRNEVPLLSAGSHLPSEMLSPSLVGFFPHLRFACSSLSHCLLSPLAEYTLFLTRSVQPFVSLSLDLGIFPFAQCYVYCSQDRLLVFASVIFWDLLSLRAGCRKHLGPHLSSVWTGGLFFSINLIAT